ncbi:MAG: sigma-54-dependent Fis family transcriptional regulator [candidate division Zixibacteria bacterium]|nr:sigma-54-dependent Fis family transcriptional regulator [candidate division Zixibacteria bacterium]
MPSILIVDDEPGMRNMLFRLFTKNGFDTSVAQDKKEAIIHLESQVFDLVLTDLRLGSDSGLDILMNSKRIHPETEVIIMTAYGTVETAVQAILNGASDYITKPFKSAEVVFKVNKALEHIDLRHTIRYLRQEVAHQFGYDNIIGTSKIIDNLKSVIDRIAGMNISILITGESGTGKELFAKVTHHHSDRRDKSFVPINCSAIPENLLESELFGHVKGSFTNAITNKKGLFEEAEGGTIFLDEVGDLPYPLQAKILRVLQEKEVRPVGGNHSRKINVRIIAATNADLSKMVSEGTFREDLYYRLNVMPILIPALRERPEDIPALAEYFLKNISKEYNRSPITLSADGLELLLKHNWPGNVRELENTLKRAVALSGRNQIQYEDIIFISPRETQLTTHPTISLSTRSLQDGQKLQILKSLEENNWNHSLTANQLGIGRTTLWRKIKKFNLAQPAKMK